MRSSFPLRYEGLFQDRRMSAFASDLSVETHIDSAVTFNRFCQKACRLWEQHFGQSGIGQTTSLFQEQLRRVEQGGSDVIQTSWGGVAIDLHEPPRVEKYLVIRKGGYLALETHEEKDERLEVREGAGLLLWREAAAEALTVQALTPRDQFHFRPGMEHCLIGTENLLVFERSIDPKGMDQDLVFIYLPDPSPSQL